MANCSYCDASYPTKQHLKQHLDTWRPCCIKYHGDNPSAPGFSPEFEYSCDRCRIRFASPPIVDDQKKQACCDHQDFFSQSLTSESETSSADPSTIGTQPLEKKQPVSSMEAIERAIRRGIVLLQVDQYIPPPCHFCREADPVFWQSDEHKVCSKCKESYLDVHRLKYIQNNGLRRNDSSIQPACLPQVVDTPTSGNSSLPSSPPLPPDSPQIIDTLTPADPPQHVSSTQPTDSQQAPDSSTSTSSSQSSSPLQCTPEIADALISAPPAGYIPSHISKIESCVQCRIHYAGECWTRESEENCYTCAIYGMDCTRRRSRGNSNGVQMNDSRSSDLDHRRQCGRV